MGISHFTTAICVSIQSSNNDLDLRSTMLIIMALIVPQCSGVKMISIDLVNIHSHRISFFQRLRIFFGARETRLIIGMLLLLFGILFIIVGIRPISGFEQIYFYWSFSSVNPFAGLKPGIYPGFPAVVTTYEILIPWVLLGIVSSGLGIILLAREFGRNSSPGKDQCKQQKY